MNALQVREALRSYWPSDRCLTLEEVGQDSGQSGRKIDMLVVNIWGSRGHFLEAVEIKVSVSDWKAELKNPAKADWWWQHTNRFWLAVPFDMVTKVRDDVPETWGLLSISGTGKVTQTISAPTRRIRVPMEWTAVVGMLRNASGAGAGALMRAESRGREQGFKDGESAAERNVGDDFYKGQAEAATARLKAFCDEVGLDPRDLEYDAAATGRLWKAMRAARADPVRTEQHLLATADNLDRHAKAVRDIARTLTDTELTGAEKPPLDTQVTWCGNHIPHVGHLWVPVVDATPAYWCPGGRLP